ncbi:hypothetical protein K493DRAFT_408276 [Basidiobolus meristosporus CBS 931.73]|uniref:Fibronectin type-III domain-containing protein n=1 Tax=Basidiobolus meristosporus CBS 931.73 TaxID=1314790 RepID=A0A1Y1Y6Z4_9FUNG|nr:hypothetical protein K493DRAFT_408276 [Basidiobolus meristosporus CBS 931.73]|eukprot:ORX93782.1 hypothetical protein K493DRAFT_408276 [Basidiobolus meristosporus CBS 931.73]
MHIGESVLRTIWRRLGSPYLKDSNFLDHLAAALDRHRGFSVVLAWLLIALVDYCINIPAEWLLFSYFTYSIFFNAFSINIAAFVVFFTLILLTSGLTYVLVSYEVTNFLASSVANASLVHGIHGLGGAGWTLVFCLSVIQRQVLWPYTLPSRVMAPVAAHCTSVGFLWLLYHMGFLVHSSVEKIGLFFGLVIPKPPVIYIKNVKETGTSVYWVLPEKLSIEKYLIEINGDVVGESDRQETSVEIMGLSPDTWYKIRVWAVSKSRIRASSQCIIIKTLSQSKSELLSKSLDSLLPGKTGLPGEGEPRDSITEAMLQDVRNEWTLTKKQCQEIRQSGKEILKQSGDEEKKLRDELERLRTLKRAEEAPRMKLKSRLKSLDEAKIEADAARVKLERELKQELLARQHAQDELHAKQVEKDSVQNALAEMGRRSDQNKLDFEAHYAESIETNVKHEKAIALAESELEEVLKLQQSLESKIAAKEEELEKILTENVRRSEADGKLRNRSHSLDQEHRALFQNYLQIQDLERNIKDRLVRLDHEKWAIMQELNKARRLGRLDDVYAGRYRLFGGNSLPETHYRPQMHLSNTSHESLFATQGDIPASTATSTLSPASKLHSLFSTRLSSSGAVGERRSTGNSLRNLTVNNNSAPDLITRLGPTSVPSTNGLPGYEFDHLDSSESPNNLFKSHHRHQSSRSLFEYGPVADSEELIASNETPARCKTASPEFIKHSTPEKSFFSMIRKPSFSGPAASNGASKSRTFNLFKNPTSNDEPLPSGIFESANNEASMGGQSYMDPADSKSENSTFSPHRSPFSSRFESFSGWSITRKKHNK